MKSNYDIDIYSNYDIDIYIKDNFDNVLVYILHSYTDMSGRLILPFH